MPATSLIGTIPDARLSTNVALQSNPNLNFAGAVSATNFTGAGHGLTNVPGAFFWVTVAGTSSQIFPNVGYIATNNTAPVILTLPLSPSVGDVYKVAGVGAGGWIIAQNTNQMIAAGNLSDSSRPKLGSQRLPPLNWSAIASSADGTKLVAAVNGGYIYTSTNSGATWTQQNGSNSAVIGLPSPLLPMEPNSWRQSVIPFTHASQTGDIYTSTDSGVTWTPAAAAAACNWSSVASSADGTKLVAAVIWHVYVSSNAGANWPIGGWDAARLGFVLDFRRLFGGWNQSGGGGRAAARFTPPPTPAAQLDTTHQQRLHDWTAVASSADGSRLVAAASSGQIYISTDSGVTWMAQNSPDYRPMDFRRFVVRRLAAGGHHWRINGSVRQHFHLLRFRRDLDATGRSAHRLVGGHRFVRRRQPARGGGLWRQHLRLLPKQHDDRHGGLFDRPAAQRH